MAEKNLPSVMYLRDDKGEIAMILSGNCPGEWTAYYDVEVINIKSGRRRRYKKVKVNPIIEPEDTPWNWRKHRGPGSKKE